MTPTRLFAVAAVAVLLGACEGKLDPREADEADNNVATAPVSAEGKAEEGKISLKMPGVDMTISLPRGVANEARAERDSKLLYPGSTLRGMAIAAGPDSDKSGDSEVEIRFSTADAPAKVEAWYRDPARAEGFRLERASREGDAILFTGIQKKDEHRFRLRVTPRPGGGSDGRLTVRHHD